MATTSIETESTHWFDSILSDIALQIDSLENQINSYPIDSCSIDADETQPTVGSGSNEKLKERYVEQLGCLSTSLIQLAEFGSQIGRILRISDANYDLQSFDYIWGKVLTFRFILDNLRIFIERLPEKQELAKVWDYLFVLSVSIRKLYPVDRAYVLKVMELILCRVAFLSHPDLMSEYSKSVYEDLLTILMRTHSKNLKAIYESNFEVISHSATTLDPGGKSKSSRKES